MALAGQLYIDARGAPRRPVDADATLRDPDRRPVDVRVTDLSETGFRVVAPVSLAVGDAVSLGLGGWGVRPARVIRRDGDSYGCAFIDPLPPGEVERARAAATDVIALFADRDALADEAPPALPRLSVALRATIIVALGALAWVLFGAIAWVAFG